MGEYIYIYRVLKNLFCNKVIIIIKRVTIMDSNRNNDDGALTCLITDTLERNIKTYNIKCYLALLAVSC